MLIRVVRHKLTALCLRLSFIDAFCHALGGESIKAFVGWCVGPHRR